MRYLILAVVLAFAACTKEKPVEKQAADVGVDVRKDPIGALGAIGKMAKDAEKAQKEMENMKPVDPLHFSKLLEVLPDAPSGWTASEPKGESTTMGEMKISQANRTYSKESGGEVKVTVTDWAYHQALYMPFLLQANFSQESTDGYSKGIKIGEDPGREEYKIKARDGKRSVLVGKRYNVSLDITDLAPSAFDEWWARVKLASLPAK